MLLDRAGEIVLPPVSYVRHNPLAEQASGTDAAGHHAHHRWIDAISGRWSFNRYGAPATSRCSTAWWKNIITGLRTAGRRAPEVPGVGAGPAGGLLAWSSAPRHIGSRDRYIGWSGEARRRNILPGVQHTIPDPAMGACEHLASQYLGRWHRISADWEGMYGHPVYFLETFVDPERFRGTCYRAANWQLLGLTTGRGKDDQTGRPNRSIKEVLGYAVHRRFRQLLSEAAR